MAYILSTATASTAYTTWVLGSNGIPRRGDTIHIQGGAGLATKNLITPRGVVTKVTDKELESLKKNPDFIAHMEAGFLSIESKDVTNVDKAADGMASGDGSKPDTPADLAAKGDKPGTTGKK